MLQAIGKTLILKPLKQDDEVKKGSLYLPTAEKNTSYADVIATGPDVDPNIKPGCTVILMKRAGFSFDHQGENFLHITQAEVIGIAKHN